MTFGQVLLRGLSAANRSIVGMVLLILLFGLLQASSVIIGGLSPADRVDFTPFAMGYSCFSCFWVLVIVIAGPWVTAGVVGQLRDRIDQPGDVPESFAEYGGRFYLRLFALTLILFSVLILLSLILGLAAWAVMFEQFDGLPTQPAQLQQLQTHPASMAIDILGKMSMCAILFLFNLATSIAVIERTDVLASLGRAFDFIRGNVWDTGRLFGASALLAVISWGTGAIPTLFDIHAFPVLLVLGVVTGIFVPYMLLLNLAWAVSLWLARTPASTEDTAGAETLVSGSDQPIDDPPD